MQAGEAVRARARPTVFFIAAAIHATVTPPLWVFTYGGFLETGLRADWHASEMIFGYAYAVFGGFFLTRVPRAFFMLLLVLWLAARIAALVPAMSAAGTAALSIAYPCLVFGYAAWPFLRAAKRWRNAVFVPLLAALLAAAVVHGTGAVGTVWRAQGIRLALDLIAIMLFVMGGRFTAAAVSGAVQRHGDRLHRPAQPGLERAGLICLVAIAVVDLAVPDGPVTALLAAIAAIIVLARLWFWRGWRVFRETEVLFLLLGYAWLSAGFVARALSAVSDAIAPVEADHILAVGALGTLSMTVMSRVARQRCGFSVQFKPILTFALFLVSLAALLRFLAAFDIDRIGLLLGAAACWSTAFIILATDLFVLWSSARRPG